jgi:hypothetical protein
MSPKSPLALSFTKKCTPSDCMRIKCLVQLTLLEGWLVFNKSCQGKEF